MKSFFLIGILFLTSSIAFAQNSRNQESSTTIAIGVNTIDNNNRKVGGIVPFIGGNINFKTPFFITAEHRFESDFSTSLSLTTNQLTIKTGQHFYTEIDATGQFYFNDYLFDSQDIETYVGIGLGRYFFDNKGNNIFNVLGGVRYWFSDQYGITSQLGGKIGICPVNVDVRNNYQLNLGLVWRN